MIFDWEDIAKRMRPLGATELELHADHGYVKIKLGPLDEVIVARSLTPEEQELRRREQVKIDKDARIARESMLFAASEGFPEPSDE